MCGSQKETRNGLEEETLQERGRCAANVKLVGRDFEGTGTLCDNKGVWKRKGKGAWQGLGRGTLTLSYKP